MTNVLVITSYWPTEANSISGIFVAQQLNAFCRSGFHITVVVGRTIGRDRARLLSPKELGLSDQSVHLIELPYFRLPELFSRHSVAMAVNTYCFGHAAAVHLNQKDGARAYSICIIHGLRYGGLSLPAWSKFVPAKKLIVIHGVDPVLTRPSLRAYLQRRLRRVDASVEKFILVGSPLARHASTLGIKSNRHTVIANGAELPRVGTEPGSRSDSHGKVTVVSVSNLIRLKGVDQNIRALAMIDSACPNLSWEYEIIGDGPERDALERLAKSLGISDRVFFRGRLEYEETMSALSRADIFSLPSWGEAFGIVYLEAMMRGLPAVGCHENGAADIISDGTDGFLVQPLDPEALSKVLKRLIEDKALRFQMGHRARSRAETFTWDANVQRILQVAGLKTER